ncbi:terminase large subunit domain-containing protein [Bradyrhizobium yuanmingense]|uniref:terminase large subunit domain-containing protein n=1 Tax=Bradyrhizobium yuanmingense TaxID=108015 RepID=UPI0023B93AF4|nr:terminase family protein [Bradyrhizobium yuanmingense]MDF0583308.1 terminase family protein [Bradyrhizobium yuanmingense]
MFLATLFGLPLDGDQLALFQQCTARTKPDPNGYREAHLVCGRRSGKSFTLALTALYLATVRSWLHYLAPGERATIMTIAADRRQARTILRYAKGLLSETPMLKPLIENERSEAIDLTNRVTIEVHTASYRSIRGYTIVAALCDEAAFWRSEESASSPDFEILNALRPGLASIPDGLLLIASSPYARKGALWNAYRKHFGKNDSPVLVWQARTRTMNPTIPQSIIDAAYDEDPASAAAEYGAEFRSDIESYINLEVVQACISLGVFERAPQTRWRYIAFTDPSGGSNDSFTLAVAHRDSDRFVLDAMREVRPPFSPESVVEEFARLLRTYGISRVTGDRYAGEWPREQFRKYGIAYEVSARPKSDLYRDLLPLLNSRRADLLDNSRLATQLVGLERRTARGGRDSIDHSPGGHDDLANCVAGVLTTVAGRQRKVRTGSCGYGGPVTETDPRTGRPINHQPTRIKWVNVREADAPAARGAN